MSAPPMPVAPAAWTSAAAAFSCRPTASRAASSGARSMIRTVWPPARARIAMPRAMLPAPMMVICMVNLLTAVPEDPRPTQPVRPLPGCVGRVRFGQVGGGVGGQGDDEGFDGRRGEGVHRGDLVAPPLGEFGGDGAGDAVEPDGNRRPGVGRLDPGGIGVGDA